MRILFNGPQDAPIALEIQSAAVVCTKSGPKEYLVAMSAVGNTTFIYGIRYVPDENDDNAEVMLGCASRMVEKLFNEGMVNMMGLDVQILPTTYVVQMYE